MVIVVVYQIVNVINDKKYIGQTIQHPSVRWSEHKYKLGRGLHDNPHLQYAWNKYGKDAFEFSVLDTAVNIDELNQKETYLIEHHNTRIPTFGYNLRTGGKNGIHSLESRHKISNALRGKKHSEESKVKRALSRRKVAYPCIVSPSGITHSVSDMTNFCRLHGLHQTGMFDLVNGKCRQYKGWTLQGTVLDIDAGDLIASRHRPTGYPSLKSPDGYIHSNIKNLSKFCADNGLTPSNLSAVVHGKAKSHKGWKLA